jgi:hypothetical protein
MGCTNNYCKERFSLVQVSTSVHIARPIVIVRVYSVSLVTIFYMCTYNTRYLDMKGYSALNRAHYLRFA